MVKRFIMLSIKLAEDLGVIKKDWNGFNVLHRAASRVGALDVGFVPQAGGRDFADILEGTRDGDIKAVYLAWARMSLMRGRILGGRLL